MNRKIFLRLACYGFVLSGIVTCGTADEHPPLLESLPPDKTGLDFSNNLFEDEYLNIISFEYFYNGAGVGAGDFNNDGLVDIFFTANMVSNRLYLNKGNFRFEDITKQAGVSTFGKWATGVSVADVNQDGWPDIYVCYAGPFMEPDKRANELYINQGDNTFVEQAHAYGLADTGHTVQAAFFDYDRDGDLDVYLLTNITDETGPNVIRPKRTHGEMVNTDRLYRNNGDGTFTNVSARAGITMEGYGLGVSIADIDLDGWPDIYVSNDYLSNDLLYINNHDGTFTNRADHYFKHTSYSAMGNDVADFNNDGLPDLVAVDMLPPDNERQKLMFGATNHDRYRSELATGYAPQFMRNTLQLNSGPGRDSVLHFSEIGQYAGIHASDWSWSPLLVDLDNDGWKDLVVTNGYPHDITNRDFASYKADEFAKKGFNKSVQKDLVKALNTLEGAYLPNFVYQNGRDLTFSDQSAVWGFTQSSYSTGAAYADLDNDGDLDLVISNTNAPAFVYRNNADRLGRHFLRLSFTGPRGNNQGLGTKVWVYCADSVQYFEHSPYRGFQSTVEAGIHVGVGRTTMIDSVVIQWPDEKRQVMHNVLPGQFLNVNYRDATAGRYNVHAPEKRTEPFFKPADKKYSPGFVHRESRYVDFKVQPLLPHLCSQDGPGIAAGDVNGDGLDDFYVGGAFNQSGQLFIQKKDGSFQSGPLTTDTKYEEDMGALLFDADQDGDNDLYVASGGNEFEQGSPYYQDRLYINDGQGNFRLRRDALPALPSSGSCVVAADYDGDGDLDLFTGGRLTPQHYPQPGQSYILQNNGGRFEDVTDAVAPGLKNAGLVTAALWTDVNNDDRIDLIVTGEWMPVMIFENTGRGFKQITDAVPQSAGWWNSICAADFDKDGDTDYILGNLGLNARYKTSAQEPVRLYVADLNADGVADPVMAHYIDGVNRPAHPRDDLLLQVTPFKKKYPSYQAYAEATMEHVLGEAQPKILQCETFSSAYLENKGKDGWLLKPLPARAQFAPVFGTVTGDFNGDGHEDVAMVGNSYAPDVLTGRYDAFTGLLLAGDGKGNFSPARPHEGGLIVDGDAKGLSLLIKADNRILLIATQNNDSLRIAESTAHVKTLPVTARDTYAIVTHKDGRKSKHEFYFGSGYLSQSSRRFLLPADAMEVTVYDYTGKGRAVVK